MSLGSGLGHLHVRNIPITGSKKNGLASRLLHLKMEARKGPAHDLSVTWITEFDSEAHFHLNIFRGLLI